MVAEIECPASLPSLLFYLSLLPFSQGSSGWWAVSVTVTSVTGPVLLYLTAPLPGMWADLLWQVLFQVLHHPQVRH